MHLLAIIQVPGINFIYILEIIYILNMSSASVIMQVMDLIELAV